MLSTANFDFCKTTKTLSAEISSLEAIGESVGQVIIIKSQHTGKLVKFQSSKVVEDRVEGEVLWVEYSPLNSADCPKVSKVIIFND